MLKTKQAYPRIEFENVVDPDWAPPEPTPPGCPICGEPMERVEFEDGREAWMHYDDGRHPKKAGYEWIDRLADADWDRLGDE